MRLAWAVISRNAPDCLAETLQSLINCAGQNCPFLVSDDSDDPLQRATQIVVEQFKAHYITGPKRGIVANRRNALLAALALWSPTHVFFLDDDMDMNQDAYRAVMQIVHAFPNDIICLPTIQEQEHTMVSPSEVNWRGLRNKPAPETGGSGLSDQCMLWPVSAALSVVWDETFTYGYAEAWLGVQAAAKGYTIRILNSKPLLHRELGRGMRASNRNDIEAARVYYNYLIKRTIQGPLSALFILLIDGLFTNLKCFLRCEPSLLPAYLHAMRAIQVGRWREEAVWPDRRGRSV